MRKLTRTQLRAWAQAHVASEQGGKCPITGRVIDFSKSGRASDWVVDHDHRTGEIRGVLTRGANGMEGKVFNAVARWGGVGNDTEKVVAMLKRLVDYLERPGCGVMYPSHKTEEEKRLARNAKARTRRAETQARKAVRSMPSKPKEV